MLKTLLTHKKSPRPQRQSQVRSYEWVTGLQCEKTAFRCQIDVTAHARLWAPTLTRG